MRDKLGKSQQNVGPTAWNNPLIFVVMMVPFLWLFLLNSKKVVEEIPYSQFLSEVSEGKIASVVISETGISGEFKAARAGEKKYFSSTAVEDPALVGLLRAKGVVFRGETKKPFWASLLSWFLPFLLVYGAFKFYAKRSTGGGTQGIFGLAKSKVRVYVEKDIKTTFADVAGVDEAKEELKEVVSFLEDPKRFSRLGGRSPKGVLLIGPPGTGKTLMAKAVAGEANVPFLSINGSEFVEMFVGIGAARVRDVFAQSRTHAPCILFIDEVDALGKARGSGFFSGGHDEKEQTLNQLLAEMDGFDTSAGIIILAATNRPETLDPALLRAGRFDRQVLIGNPDQVGRTQILGVHCKSIPLDASVNLERISALTPGFSGADLANLVNEAAIVATRRNADTITEPDFTAALERMVAGLEQKSKRMNPEEKRRIAFHEMGHATAAFSLKTADRVHKVSIIPRGMGALGYTLQRPTEDRYLMDRGEMVLKIAVLLGGRACETLFFKEVSTGASDDLAKATDFSRAMVTQYGMSESVGLATFEERGTPLLSSAYPIHERRPFSEETGREIDREVKSILDKSFQLVLKSLTLNRAFIEAGARRLLEIETLDESELIKLWAEFGKSVVPIHGTGSDGVKTAS